MWVRRLRNRAQHLRGITIHIPRDDLDYTVEAGLRALIERRLLSEENGTLTLALKGESLTAFYAASVSHLLDQEWGGQE